MPSPLNGLSRELSKVSTDFAPIQASKLPPLAVSYESRFEMIRQKALQGHKSTLLEAEDKKKRILEGSRRYLKKLNIAKNWQIRIGR